MGALGLLTRFWTVGFMGRVRVDSGGRHRELAGADGEENRAKMIRERRVFQVIAPTVVRHVSSLVARDAVNDGASNPGAFRDGLGGPEVTLVDPPRIPACGVEVE